MSTNYKQTFDAVCMMPERQERIRTELSSRYTENTKEDNVVKIHAKKRLITVLIAAVVAMSLLAAAGYAYGSQIIEMLGGGVIESGRNRDGSHFTSITISESNNPAVVRDGKVYFVLDDLEIDITSYCTESTFFSFEKIDDDGYRHVLLVGGEPDNLGWASFTWDETGQVLGRGAVYMPDENDEKPIWLQRAYAEFPD